MNWLALTPLQVAALWFAGAALAVWLYLHTRRPQHRRVSTLRFWASVQPGVQPRRRRILEPWALVAQLLFLLLLIAALGNPHWGRAAEGRAAVIVFDNSVWSQVRVAGQTPWIDQTRQEALRVVDSLPPGDRVLLISAQSDAPPILPFSADHAALRRAIAAVQSSGSVANLPRALDRAKSVLAGSPPGSPQGLLVYVGPGMLDEPEAREIDDFRQQTESPANVAPAAAANGPATNSGQPQFLVHLVGGSAPVENRGITRLAVRRDPAEPDLWHLLTQLKNYNAVKTNVTLKVSVDGQPFGDRELSLAPNELANVETEFAWNRSGVVQAEITPSDALDADNHAAVNLPSLRPTRVALISTGTPFSNDLFTAALSNPYWQTEIVRPGGSPANPPDVAIYESPNPPGHLDFNSIWFVKGKPAPGAHPMRVTGWDSGHPVSRWVHTRDVSVRNPVSLRVLPGDTILASVEGNPVAPLILAREQDGHRLVLIGFDPDDSNFAQQSAFPLVLAGSIEWMSQAPGDAADSLSVGEVDMPGPAARVISPSGADVPFAPNGRDVHLFATETGSYRVIAPGGETRVPVNTPLLPAQRLQPTALETAAIASEPPLLPEWDIWRWLVLLAIIALWLEWWLYYDSRRKRELSEGAPMAAGGVSVNDDSPAEPAHDESEDRSPNLVT